MKRYFIMYTIVSIFVKLPFVHAKEFLNQEVKVAKGTVFEFYPVKSSKSGNGDCFEYGKECLLPLTKRPIFTFKDFEYQKYVEEKPGIRITVSEDESRDMEKFTRKYINTRLALVYNGKVVHAPLIRDVVSANKFEMSFCNENKFREVLKSIEPK
ncbi:MAG: hypothetical protein HQK53_06985 [Oligoflexia bacterium]|nr:hypothetical protein [Oligoflexia bacterium]